MQIATPGAIAFALFAPIVFLALELSICCALDQLSPVLLISLVHFPVSFSGLQPVGAMNITFLK